MEKVGHNFGPDSDIYTSTDSTRKRSSYYELTEDRYIWCSPATKEIVDVMLGFETAFMLNYEYSYYYRIEEQKYDYNESHLLQGIVDWMDEHYGNE